MLTIFISIILLMGVTGLIFGLILAYANKKLAVELNPLIHEVEDLLPKGQCGACGYAGCQAYAEAVVIDPKVPPDLCVPGKTETARKIADLTGKKMEIREPRVAYIKCSNPISVSSLKYKYSGINDCTAASILHLGPKDCQYGCIGFGACVSHCAFGALSLDERGLPQVDESKCTGCGKCAVACPKKIIEMIPVNAPVVVRCNSHDRGPIARKKCPSACLGCGLCAKNADHNAIHIENNLAVIDFNTCINRCSNGCEHYDAFDKCPTKAIQVRRRGKLAPKETEPDNGVNEKKE